ncbi:MAG: ATP-binding cassette domain-containing protein [Armatimonadetes bacterium]|nr:ATP-binding cassette domain-containing protein [Armatimonadota bacterium]
MPAVEVSHLRKVYVSHKKTPGVLGAIKGLVTRERTEVEAVKDISFSVEAGEFVGFLGPNGAGKTTTLKMLTGILYPSSGSATVLGYRPTDRKIEMLKRLTLLMGNKMQLWWDLPAWDGFLVLKEIYEVPDAAFKSRVEHLIEILDLSEKINVQVRKLSLGERMKCELVAALLHAPEVVFLDEPTLGLDVVSQKRVRDFLRELHRQDGSTILLTSHYMQDVAELCHRVIVIDHGSLVFDGTLDALSHRFGNERRIRLHLEGDASQEILEKLGKVISNEEGEAVLEVPADRVATVTGRALKELSVVDLKIEEVDIEDVVRRLFTSVEEPLAQESG